MNLDSVRYRDAMPGRDGIVVVTLDLVGAGPKRDLVADLQKVV